MTKQIFLRNEITAAKFTVMMARFGYSTTTHFIEDMLYFFETNPVSPRDKFNNLFSMLNSKMEEFNKDNNRVIAVLRNIEKAKFDPLLRAVGSDIAEDLRIIKKKLLFDEITVVPKNKIVIPSLDDNKKDQNPIENDLKKITESYEKKIEEHIKSYSFLQKEFDKIGLEHAKYYNKIKKISSLYTVENSTFSKGKIVFNLTEEEFKELVNLK